MVSNQTDMEALLRTKITSGHVNNEIISKLAEIKKYFALLHLMFDHDIKPGGQIGNITLSLSQFAELNENGTLRNSPINRDVQPTMKRILNDLLNGGTVMKPLLVFMIMHGKVPTFDIVDGGQRYRAILDFVKRNPREAKNRYVTLDVLYKVSGLENISNDVYSAALFNLHNDITPISRQMKAQQSALIAGIDGQYILNPITPNDCRILSTVIGKALNAIIPAITEKAVCDALSRPMTIGLLMGLKPGPRMPGITVGTVAESILAGYRMLKGWNVSEKDLATRSGLMLISAVALSLIASNTPVTEEQIKAEFARLRVDKQILQRAIFDHKTPIGRPSKNIYQGMVNVGEMLSLWNTDANQR